MIGRARVRSSRSARMVSRRRSRGRGAGDEALGVGTPKKGGLTYREAHLCLEIIADTKMLTSIDVAEINPILDIRNTTGELGAELLLSALGKRIF